MFGPISLGTSGIDPPFLWPDGRTCRDGLETVYQQSIITKERCRVARKVVESHRPSLLHLVSREFIPLPVLFLKPILTFCLWSRKDLCAEDVKTVKC